MITFSTFVNHWIDSRGRVPAAIHAAIGKEAQARVQARYAEGRADSVLCFRDLSDRLESAIMPKGA